MKGKTERKYSKCGEKNKREKLLLFRLHVYLVMLLYLHTSCHPTIPASYHSLSQTPATHSMSIPQPTTPRSQDDGLYLLLKLNNNLWLNCPKGRIVCIVTGAECRSYLYQISRTSRKRTKTRTRKRTRTRTKTKTKTMTQWWRRENDFILYIVCDWRQAHQPARCPHSRTAHQWRVVGWQGAWKKRGKA